MSRRTEKPFWDAEELQTLLQTRALGRNLVLFNRITSTNAFLKRLAQRGAAEGAVILADEQTAGRGRLGRKWQSLPGKGLWFSFLLRPRLPIDRVGVVSLAVAALIADTLAQVCGASFQVKWPNDVLLEGRKVCGILCETQMSPTNVEAIIVGIGLNVEHELEDFAPEWHATSLRLAGCESRDRKMLFTKMLHVFEQHLFTDLPRRLPHLIERWCARCEGLGSPITVKPAHDSAASQATSGIFAGLGENGELLLRMPAGDLRFFSAGEITLPRSAS